MKILVFSDTHLTDTFEEKKFKFLKKIISQTDKIIINGDFWDGYTTLFNRFIDSSWNKLFPLLKSKKTIYVYGNHDKKILSNKKVSLFSEIQTKRYELKMNGKLFVFEHGNNVNPALDDRLKLKRVPIFINKFLVKLQDLFVKKYGKRFLKVMFKRDNIKMKRKLKKIVTDNSIFICGHTHWAEVDWQNRFVNSGIIQHGLGQYLTIDSSAKITLHEEWYDIFPTAVG